VILSEAGVVMTWGDGMHGQLGHLEDMDEIERLQLKPRFVPALRKVVVGESSSGSR
jgi:hypothetical protein